MTVALVAGLALAAGYALGRLRPWVRLGEWANWQLRFHVDRWATRPRMAVLGLALVLTDPVGMWTAYRRRNEPPPPLAPPVTIRRITPD
ncbi:hypothetical protein AB0J84_32330 [Micromonospora arborensis]|uniref:hypothetical protein n=1 Tax=Micromonospora arborensis TaxID=2116518 RepID=UPI00342D9E69